MSDFASSDGAIISASNARLYREHFLDVPTASPVAVPLHERRAGTYPDPLVPFFDPYSPGNVPVGAPFDVEPGGLAVVFVDVYVPASAVPGRYSGTATVTAEGRDPAAIPVNLDVWEIDIPNERTIGTAFGFSGGRTSRFHGGPEGAAAADIDAIRARYFEALHEHRMDPTTVSGPVNFTFDAGGNLEPVDWSAYDAAVAPFLDGTKFADGVGVARFNVDHFRPGHGLGSMTEDQWAQAAAAFAEHLNEKGWWDRSYVYGIDEPWLNGGDKVYEQMAREQALLARYTDLWDGHVLVTGPFDPRITGGVGIWCPVTPMFEDWFYNDERKPGRAEYAERMALGEELWFYVCNANTPPYAGYDIDTTIGYEPRIVKWGTWFERATGFLFWSVDYWVENDPWKVFRDVPQFSEFGARNGDGFLFYPGNHDGTEGGKGSPPEVAIDGPIVSYRMKQIRDGFEDWELFRMAESLGAGDFARQQVGRAYRRFGDFFAVDCDARGSYCPDRQPWTLDESLLLEVREKIALKVQYLLHPDRYDDPEAPGADAGSGTDAATGPDTGTVPADAGGTADAAPATSGEPGGCGCSTLSIE
ncbi:MAG: DUF4091 domain-containing protein [Deltaproteobacteria bacterium]|nr:DUF4091 domain-containing protein [Deltaproteobacteria bacterium]